MAFCTKCGTQADDSANFCPACGQAMGEAPAAQGAPAAPPAPEASAAPGYQAPPQNGYQAPPPGYQTPPPQPPPQQGYQQPPPQYPPQQGYQQGYHPGYQMPPQSDAEANKGMAVLSYLGILFLIPLLMGKHKVSQFAKYHLNQGIILCIFYAGYSIVSGILRASINVTRVMYVMGYPIEYTTSPGWLNAILGLGWIPLAILVIIGIINSVKGEMKPLPVIGNLFTILN